MKKILLSILLLVSPIVQAFDIWTLWPVNSSVIDTAHVLGMTEKTALEAKIAEIRKKYTVEILTVIMPSTEGEEISALATEIGQKIGVGKADKDNGIVLLIAINDRAWNIATGYGVEWALPDLLTKKIGEKNFALFKEQKYYEGILWSLSDFDRVLSGDTSVISTQSENTGKNDTPPWFVFQFIIALGVANLFFKPLVTSGRYRKFFWYAFLAYIITLPLAYLIVQNLFFILENIGVWVVGSLFWIFWKSWRRWGGGGGFSSSGSSSGISFGGGSFGGGGSSGKW